MTQNIVSFPVKVNCRETKFLKIIIDFFAPKKIYQYLKKYINHSPAIFLISLAIFLRHLMKSQLTNYSASTTMAIVINHFTRARGNRRGNGNDDKQLSFMQLEAMSFAVWSSLFTEVTCS